MRDSTARKAKRDAVLKTTYAKETANAERQDTGETVIYKQMLTHPRLGWAIRRIEIWKSEPRVRLAFKFYRLSSELPEVFLVSFPLPTGDTSPTVSNAGIPFEPFREQIPGTAMDYFAIDGWVHYSTPQGHWIWATRDAPLVTFGEPNILAKIADRPTSTNRILAIIYNNLWHTNFVANATGEMDFNFDLVWKDAHSKQIDPAKMGDSLVSDPLLLLNPAGVADPSYETHLFLP